VDSFTDLQPWETELASLTEQDARRAGWLLQNRLLRLAETNFGYDHLYRDPTDGRYWELTHPWPEQHGGGPYVLRAITPSDAAAKYGVKPG
jgi:hypothetical protein